ncbi:fibronectin type III domain-containing protein [Myxococcus sp. 1LA]
MKTSPRLPSRVLSLLLGALLFAGCINPVSEGERPCPCTDGWTCCPDANVCVSDAARCEQLQPPKPTAPSAPRQVSAMTDPGTVTLTWFEPAQNGGSAITGYDVGVEPHEDGIQVQRDGTTARVTGLRAGGTYRFTITARNAVGAGPVASVDSVSLPDVPAAPEALAVERGDRQVRITWNAPTSDGGRAVLHYVVTAHPSGVSLATDGPVLTTTVSGLTNGVASTFTVHAVNAVGAGPASAESASVVPAARPGAPVSVAATPGVRAATVSWQPPQDTGGLPVSGYVVTASPGGTTQEVHSAASEATFTSSRTTPRTPSPWPRGTTWARGPRAARLPLARTHHRACPPPSRHSRPCARSS